MLCPDPETNCSLIPDVINNSWFKHKPDDVTFNRFIAMWEELEIIPVFCTGNKFNPASCQELAVLPPGARNARVIAVGATTKRDQLAKYSRRGVLDDQRPPDLVAPGSKIVSCSNTGGSFSASGTSMATPHVTGTIALMIDVARNHGREKLKFDTVKALLEGSTVQTLAGSEFACLPASELKNYPNAAYGYGRLSARNAVRATQIHLGVTNPLPASVADSSGSGAHPRPAAMLLAAAYAAMGIVVLNIS